KRVTEPGYFTKEKLDDVKAHRATDSAFGRERTSGFAHTLGFWWSVASLEYYMSYVDEMAKQTSADLVSYARAYIVDKPHVTGIMISPDSRRRLGLTTTEVARLGAWR